MKRSARKTDSDRPSNEALRERLDFDDARLVGECDVQIYKASGPGGQHRNKVSSAVRLCHRASGLVAIGSESRSQHENKARAIRRLREAFALAVRVPVSTDFVWPDTVEIANARLRVNEKNPAYHHVVAIVLDAFAQQGGKLKEAAAELKLTPSGLVKFLWEHRKAWREVAQMRARAGLGSLRPPK